MVQLFQSSLLVYRKRGVLILMPPAGEVHELDKGKPFVSQLSIFVGADVKFF